MDVVVVGDCNPDIVLSDQDAKVEFGQHETLFERGRLAVGGSGSITACACARLGLRTAFAGAVGTDALGDYMVSELVSRGVDVAPCVRLPDVPTGFSVIISRGQDRAILTHLGAIPWLTAGQLPLDVLRGARHVHLSSYFLLTELRPALASLFEDLRACGVTVSLDTNWDPAQVWDSGLPGVLPHVDVFLPNAAEACAIAGTPDVEEAVTALARTVPTVVAKLGADGALLVRDGRVYRHPGHPVEALDTTGAGDAFNAGFLRHWLAGRAPLECLEFANSVAALSTQGVGAVAAQPDLATAERLAHS